LTRGLKPALYVGFAALAAISLGAQQGAVVLGVADRVNQHVSVASSGELVSLVWAASKTGSGTDIYAATSRDAGRTFSTPVRVNDASSPADVNGEQPPHVVVAPPGSAATITVVWTSKSTSGTRLLTSRSTDGGKTFGSAAVVAGSDASGNRGWESIAVDPRGRVMALWLDHRDMVRSGEGGEHHHSDAAAKPASTDGAARAQSSQLFIGSLEGGASARGIARGVCYCCKTALAAGANGTIFAAWRHVYPGNYRDIAVMASRDGGQTFGSPIRVNEDGWQIDGCPENGPALAIDADQRAHVVWPTVVREGSRSTLALFHASTKDGRAFTSRAALPVGGAAYHPRLVALTDGSLLVAWDEVVDGARRIRLARGKPDTQGRVTFAAVAHAPIQAQYPAIAATPAGAVLAWSTNAGARSHISVERIPLQ